MCNRPLVAGRRLIQIKRAAAPAPPHEGRRFGKQVERGSPPKAALTAPGGRQSAGVFPIDEVLKPSSSLVTVTEHRRWSGRGGIRG